MNEFRALAYLLVTGAYLLVAGVSGCDTKIIGSILPIVSVTDPDLTEPDVPPSIIDIPQYGFISDNGIRLIVRFEGYVTIPEAPDARLSGISWGIGYDAHQNSESIIRYDWKALPVPEPNRLAATHPYYGRSAQNHLHEVKDIRVPMNIGMNVFKKVDSARTYSQCRKFMPGFDDLKQPAKDALISLIFNRGVSINGNSRKEMRELPGLVKRKDYHGIADCIRRMERVWIGTDIEQGMRSRREAEARMVES